MELAELDAMLTKLTPGELFLRDMNSGRDDKAAQIEFFETMRTIGKPLVYYYTSDDDIDLRVSDGPLSKRGGGWYVPPSFHAEMKGVKKWLCVQNHVRFVPHYEHMHTYVEINYMYSGSCLNVVDGQEIRMEAGDFLFIKPGSVHSIPWTGENDILTNIILMPHAAGAILDKTLIGANELSAFLIEALFSDTTKPNFLFLKMRGTESIQNAMARLMCEYFDSDHIASEVLIECYLRIVLALLWRESTLHPEKAVYAKSPNTTVAEIISFIHENCAGCTRDSVAEHIGYNSNYISNLLVEHTGKSFVTIRNEFRMELAEKLLNSSDITVRDVAEQCGFSNITQFYKVYREYFGRLPRKDNG